ncbi:MAG: hypothetical protein M3P51_17485 [Chloroflexota bacterium]|nr:hypothetical protein [Chloroflexota bacterium]
MRGEGGVGVDVAYQERRRLDRASDPASEGLVQFRDVADQDITPAGQIIRCQYLVPPLFPSDTSESARPHAELLHEQPENTLD